jgi:hypothetical protein
MDPKNLIEEAGKKADNASHLAEVVAENPALIPVVLEGTRSPKANLKYKCIKILRIMSNEHAAVLYPYFDFFKDLLSSTNNILKWNAMDIIANLTLVDSENKFDPLFSNFYGLLGAGDLITAAHVVEGSAVIVRSRPARESEITHALLSVETISLPTEECCNILRGKVINTFSEYWTNPPIKDCVASPKKQLINTRPATKRKPNNLSKRSLLTKKTQYCGYQS